MLDLHQAIEVVERSAPLFVWQETADSEWRVTDWQGVPDEGENCYNLARVNLIGAAGFETLGRMLRGFDPDDFEAVLRG